MKYREPFHCYYVQLASLSSLSNYFWGLFWWNMLTIHPPPPPISHCMDKIISFYHVLGDQCQAKHIAEPSMSLEGTLRSLWGQQLVICLVIRRVPYVERRIRSRITLGFTGPAGNRQMRWKPLSVYVCIWTVRIERASRAWGIQWELESSIKMV